MAGSTYKIIELVGTSDTSWEEAAKTAVETAAEARMETVAETAVPAVAAVDPMHSLYLASSRQR